MDIHKNEKDELRLWAKDDIVPSDLQELCKQAATSIATLQERIKELEAENKRLSRDCGCVESLCDSMDEFGEPMKDTQWTNLGERIYEIVVEQSQRIKELETIIKERK